MGIREAGKREEGSAPRARGSKTRAVLSLALLLAAFSAGRVAAPAVAAPREAQSSDTLTGTVVFVYDGDTIKVRLDSGGEKKVRLIGVDAPESDDPRESVRLSAFLARRFAASKLYQKPVRLVRDKEKQDVYGRLLAFVWTGEGTMFNETLVREGYASAYLKFPFDEAVKKRLGQAEAEARREKRGQWRVAPWPVVGPADGRRRLGEIVSVRFRCVRTFERARFLVLVPDAGEFEAVIPRDVLVALPGPLDFEGRTLEVTGLVEEFKGRPQIMIGVPPQIKISDMPKPGHGF